MKILLAILFSYLFGSIPWGLVIGKVFFHKDIRKEGSGNAGGTNAGRVLGKPIGVLVIALDALKGLISMTLAHFIAPGSEIYAGVAYWSLLSMFCTIQRWKSSRYNIWLLLRHYIICNK